MADFASTIVTDRDQKYAQGLNPTQHHPTTGGQTRPCPDNSQIPTGSQIGQVTDTFVSHFDDTAYFTGTFVSSAAPINNPGVNNIMDAFTDLQVSQHGSQNNITHTPGTSILTYSGVNTNAVFQVTLTCAPVPGSNPTTLWWYQIWKNGVTITPGGNGSINPPVPTKFDATIPMNTSYTTLIPNMSTGDTLEFKYYLGPETNNPAADTWEPGTTGVTITQIIPTITTTQTQTDVLIPIPEP